MTGRVLNDQREDNVEFLLFFANQFECDDKIFSYKD